MKENYIENIREINRGKLAAKFDLKVGEMVVRDCCLWNGADGKPQSATGPGVRAGEREPWIRPVHFSKEMAAELVGRVVSAIERSPLHPAPAPPSAIPDYERYDKGQGNVNEVQVTGPVKSTRVRKTFAEMKREAVYS